MRFPSVRAMAAGVGAVALTAAASVAAAPVASAAPAPPPECGAGCEQVFHLSFPNDASLSGWRDNTAPGGRSVLAYSVSGQVHDTAVLEHKGVTDAACGWQGDAQRCAVTFYTGAHSTGALSALLTWNGGIEISDEILGGAPGATLRQLDGSGRPDVALRQSTYEPSYADAPQYWETYLEFDGEFVRTGCTRPEQGNSPAPTEPVYGSCRF
ncbi:hypothetical protein FHX42_000532 [Saccharopolyspora lacisalsi]|uniref:Secreted protein n=1 Tax=Halosaccharopolyspora lacisalsi TaxID=1000566 RepID=A0A839DQ55_9PSEU|nr:hypothetical protein [Halosaccharopolyspora lacisalsi]MBA8823203.1 hypothetical protein [Halosaccharopolyspora lacisalsi]